MISVKSILHFILATLLLVAIPHKSTADDIKKKNDEINVNYVDEDIINIINDLSNKMNVNVILPTGAQALNIKVNFSLNYKINLEKAWNLLFTYLDMAGYSLLPKNNMWIIVKNNKEVFDAKNSRQPTRLFIDTPPSALPMTDERITYLYYLSNLTITDASDNRIGTIAADLLPEQTFYKVDSTTNSILVTAKSFDVRTFMELVIQLDQSEYKEKLEIIPLRHANASQVAQIFNNQILKSSPTNSLARYRADLKKPTEGSYFPESVKIIAYEPRNALVVMGRMQAIERIRNFVYKYIDVELESGKSILHVYKLQYLDAEQFAPVLQQIVNSSRTGGTGQSVGGKQQGSTERYFDEVIIEADKPAIQSGSNGTQYSGGNKLIVAARNDDWKRIKTLIEELDRPQAQVIIEVLIADLSLNDSKQLATQIRNPAGIPFPETVSAQAAHLTPVVIEQDTIDNITYAGGTTLATDLIEQRIDNFTGSPSDITPAQFQNLVGGSIGSTIFQLADDDGKTWSILKILKQFSYAKILSHPHVIVRSGHKANVTNGQTRLVDDQADPSAAGTIRKKKEIKAELKIDITPRISAEKEVILQIDINIDEFSTEQFDNADRNTRKLSTNAYLKSGDILALGGLVKTNLTDSSNGTPLLSRIPILGWFFKSRSGREDQTSLAVFIMPTVIHAKFREGIDNYTQSYANLIKDYAHEENLFHGLQDPITRWFFHKDLEAESEIDHFITQQRSSYDMPEYIEKDYSSASPAESITKSILNDATTKVIAQNSDAIDNSVLEDTKKTENNLEQDVATLESIDEPITHKKSISSRSNRLKSLLNSMDSPFKA